MHALYAARVKSKNNDFQSTDTTPDTSVREELASIIPAPVSTALLADGLEAFQAEYNLENVCLCAACGRRDMVKSHKYRLQEEAFMKCLQLDDSAAEMYEQRPEIVREVMNVYRFPSDGNLYYLLPDHLNEVEDGATIICAACGSTLKKEMMPKFSLASGYDFGRLDMLEPLSLLEKIVVSPYRTFATICKNETFSWSRWKIISEFPGGSCSDVPSR